MLSDNIDTVVEHDGPVRTLTNMLKGGEQNLRVLVLAGIQWKILWFLK